MNTFYCVAYRAPDQQVLRSANFYDLETASRIASDLNRQFNQPGEYFIEGATVAELTSVQLVRLFRLKLIPYSVLLEHAGATVAAAALKQKYGMEQLA